MGSTKNNPVQNSKNTIILIGGLFFIFGFVTWLNSVLIPYLKIACQLNHFQSYLVAFAFYIAYFLMAPLSTKTLKIFGFKNGMSVGLLIMAVGAFLFIPAALSRTYSMFLVGLFIQGSGLAILQTASNPYITIAGPLESAAKRISIMGICNKLAGALAPLVLGFFLQLEDADKLSQNVNNIPDAEKNRLLDELATRVISPYIGIIIVLGILAFIIYRSGLPEIDTDSENDPISDIEIDKKNVFHFPHILLGFLAIFMYVGVEVIAGDTVISFAKTQGVPFAQAPLFTTANMLFMIMGFSIGIITIPRYLEQKTALKICSSLGIIFSLLTVFSTGYFSVCLVALLGLSNSLIWPAIWPLVLDGMGRFTKAASSLLVMGISGGAILPLIYGALADMSDPQKAYLLLVPCYFFIWYFGYAGHKAGKKNIA